jgi:hypothetical protein
LTKRNPIINIIKESVAKAGVRSLQTHRVSKIKLKGGVRVKEESTIEERDSVLEGWADFCKDYKPTTLTEREKTGFKSAQVAEDRVEKFNYASREVVR